MNHVKAIDLCIEAYNHSDCIWSAFETDALVIEEQDCTWVCFRGTEAKPTPTRTGWSNFFDVIKDLRIFPYRTLLGWWAHKGFAKGAEAWVHKYGSRLNPRKKLYLTGHSLGAAVAVQAVPLLKAKGVSTTELVVFAEPASWYRGDEHLYQRLQVPSTSYINANDFIRAVVPWAKTGVHRTYLNPKKGVSFKEHSSQAYKAALIEQGIQ